MTGLLVKNEKDLESTVDFSRYTKELKKHWLKVFFIVAAVTGGMFPLVQKITDIYASTATVLIQANEDNVTPLEQVVVFDSTQSEYYTTQHELAGSRAVMENAIRALNLIEHPDFNGETALKKKGLAIDPDLFTDQVKLENAIEYMEEYLTVTGIRNTQIMLITFESSDPVLAAEIANGVAQAYINIGVQRRLEKTRAAEMWNDEQNRQLKQQILDKQKEIHDLLREEDMLTFNGVDGYETEQMMLLGNRYSEAKSRRIAAKAEYDTAAIYRGRSLEEIITLPMFSEHSQLQHLRIALTQARRTLYELQKRYGPKHDKILRAEAEIQAIKEQSVQLFEELMKTVYKKYVAAQKEENQYKALMDDLRKKFHNMAEKKDKYYDLKIDLDQMEEIYKNLYARMKEQQLSLHYKEPNALLQDEAVPAKKPIKPNRILLLVMVVMFTLILCCVFLILKAALNNKIRSMSELERRIGIKALGDIREEKGLEILPLERLKEVIFASKIVSETFHGVRTALLLNQKVPSNTLGIVSANDGEGTEAISYMLAHSFSDRRRTALLDMNFRSDESLSGKLGYGEAPGIGEIYSSDKSIDDVVVKLDKVDFFPRGNVDISPLSVLMSYEVADLFEKLTIKYDRVFVNLPASRYSKDAQLVGQRVDSALIVVKAGHSSATEIRSTVEKLTVVGTPVIGGLVTHVKASDVESEESIQLLHLGIEHLISREELKRSVKEQKSNTQGSA